MSISLLTQDDNALNLRVKRQLMGFVSYLMFVLPLMYSVQQGWVRFGYAGLAAFAAVAVAVNIVFFLAIRTGYSTRFEDPSLAMPQIMVAVMLALVMSYYADEARVVTLMLFFTAFFFGVFSMTTRHYLMMTAVTAVGYAIMLALKFPESLRSSETFRVELLHLLMLVIVLLWMSLLGGYIARLRGSLAQKKDALALALVRLKELASHDELTGVYNRRHLMEILEQQKERAERYGEAFSACILDLDHFKQLNDLHGHQVGDEALCEFSSRMRLQARRMDAIGRAPLESTFGRYGGEEFLLLLPHTDMDGAALCVDRLRTETHANPINTSAGMLQLTFSAGVAAYRLGESVVQMLNRADAALYRAKAAGRDRVEIAD